MERTASWDLILAEWCNGNTNDSDSFIPGSNPGSAATYKRDCIKSSPFFFAKQYGFYAVPESYAPPVNHFLPISPPSPRFLHKTFLSVANAVFL